MKFKTLYLLFASMFIYVVFISSSSGPGSVQNRDRTGSPVAASTCGACHNAGAFNPSLDITLLDGADTIRMYEPGQKYTIRFVNTASDDPVGYGVQAVVLDGNDNNIGTFGDAPSGTQITPLDGRSYFEHDSRSTSNTFEIEWTAPEAETGDVSIFASSVAANGASGSGGDGTASKSLVIQEAITSSVSDQTLGLNIAVLPNPVSDQLNLQLSAEGSHLTNMSLFNINGQLIQENQLNVTSGSNYFNFDVSHLPKGQYFLQLHENGKVATKKIMKL